MNKDNRPLSEIYKEVGDDWADLNAAATILEDTITIKRAQRQLAIGSELPVNKTELIVKAMPESKNDVVEAAEARKAANKKKVYLDSIKMRHSEEMNLEANHRAEARL